jgi:uncharacterized protein (TIGR03083 family)
MLDKATYLEAIRSSVPLLTEAAQSDLTAPIPTCPGWYMATLVAHLSEVERFWAYQVSSNSAEFVEMPNSALEAPPGLVEWAEAAEKGVSDIEHVPAGLLDWFERSVAHLIEVFSAVDPEGTHWHWSGDNRGITHLRNQAMEHTVHRWDAQNAVDKTTPIDPAIALDGIEQHFEVQVPAGRKWHEAVPGAGETFHLHRTDGEGEWLVRFEGDGYTVRREHAKGDIAIRGTVEDLFLWLWGRTPGDRLEVHGDVSLLGRYRELAPTG